jgi:hypothetical protein
MPMKTCAELGTYFHTLITGQLNLKKKHNGALLSNSHGNKMFLDDFSSGIAKSIKLCLMLSNPNHNYDLAYTINKVFKIANMILSSRPGASVALLGPQAAAVKQEYVASMFQALSTYSFLHLRIALLQCLQA